MNSFNFFISGCDFYDPPISNAKYTWSNLRAQPILSRLDRFLYTPDWEIIFEQHFSRRLPRETSDHFPISLESNSIKWGPHRSGSTTPFSKMLHLNKTLSIGGQTLLKQVTQDILICGDSNKLLKQ